MIAQQRDFCQREALLGVIKRNRNVPQLQNNLDDSYVADDMFNNFLDTCISKEGRNVIRLFKDDQIFVTPELLQEWLEKQPQTVRGL